MTETSTPAPVKTALVTKPQQGVFANISNFENSQRMVQALTISSLVPPAFRGRENAGNALIALELAQRIGASPLMVMQNLYVVHGTPAWSAKFKIATFNQCERFTVIRYEWKGTEGELEYGCRGYCTEKKTGEKVVGAWIDWRLVKAEGWDNRSGSKWKTMPEKMFMYRAASWLVDAYAPEISMGLPTSDELHDIYDVDPVTGEILAPEPETSRTATVAERLQAQAAEAEQTSAQKDAAVTPEQLLQMIETADGSDTLKECEDLAGSLDRRSRDYKAVTRAIEEKREQFE